jgi:homoserine O-acetyltransferase/O-succinyltransferase
MMNLEKVIVPQWVLENGNILKEFPLFYQTFGQPLGTSPIVLVNHALTGNSNVTGIDGWWNDLIAENKTIDTNYFTVIAINIPGNGYDGDKNNLIQNYKDFTIRDIAQVFWLGLYELDVNNLFATIGGSLGGAIAWEMAAIAPDKIENIIPIATDWKATDWMIANVFLQDNILNNSSNPIQDARIHAMLLYRTPQSLKKRFEREYNQTKSMYQIQSWLAHHGDKLKDRFTLSAYKIMNHLLKTNDITRNRGSFLEVATSIKSNIHFVVVDSDLFFVASENLESYNQLKKIKNNISYHEIQSIHGHDAFLMEYQQLTTILEPIFKKQESFKSKE